MQRGHPSIGPFRGEIVCASCHVGGSQQFSFQSRGADSHSGLSMESLTVSLVALRYPECREFTTSLLQSTTEYRGLRACAVDTIMHYSSEMERGGSSRSRIRLDRPRASFPKRRVANHDEDRGWIRSDTSCATSGALSKWHTRENPGRDELLWCRPYLPGLTVTAMGRPCGEGSSRPIREKSVTGC